MNRVVRLATAPALVALVGGLSLAGLLASPAPGATPDTGGADATAPGVSLVSQSPWIATQGSELIALHLDEPTLATTPGAAVQLTIHRSVDSRSAFQRAISGDERGGIRVRLSYPLSSLARNKRGEFAIAFGLRGSGAQRAVAIDEAGVYPVEVGVVGAGRSRGTFLTWLVVVDRGDTPIPERLRVSWIWRLTGSPPEQAGAAVDTAEVKPGGRLSRISTLLGRAGKFPLTLGIGPETLESWAVQAQTDPALAPGITRVRRAAARPTIQLLPEPYVPVDGPTIEAEGLGAHVPDEYIAGSTAIERATAVIPDPRTAFVDPVDDATVGRLTRMLVGRFVVRDSALVPAEERLTPAQPFSLTTAAAPGASAIATDSRLEDLVHSSGPPALRSQRVLAALAEIAYEAPARARGVVLATPPGWAPDVATVTLLLHQLANYPLVQPTTLDELFATVLPDQRDGTPSARALAPSALPAVLPLQADEYATAERELTAYRAMVGADDPSVAAGQRSLLLSLSTANTRAQALAHLQTIHTSLSTLTSGISTTVKTLTLTARRASLPLSFQNDTKRSGVQVRVHLASAKLLFPKGADRILTLATGHTTVRFPVEARVSGTFTMTVTLESADGSLALGPPTHVIIRSAVFSGIGIALTLGALLFLAGWWGNHFWRTRRARRTTSAS